jgi:Ca2+-binding RTX toxin-like protein
MEVLAGRPPRAWIAALACLLTVAAICSAAPRAAAAPSNDDFANAAALHGLPTEGTGSNVGATLEVGEPSHRGYGGQHSIWFKWTAPADAGVTLSGSNCAPPFTDPSGPPQVMAIYVGSSVDALVEVAGGNEPFRVTAGQIYWIAVDTIYGPPDPAICVRLLAGPSNDDFRQATRLEGFPASANQTIPNVATFYRDGGSTREADEPFHAGDTVGGSVWYRWTATEDRTVRLRACALKGVLAVYTGDRLDALTNVATRRATERGCGPIPGASVELRGVSGQTYQIAIASLGSPESPPSLNLTLGSQVAVVNIRGTAFFSYVAFPGEVDALDLRLVGAGRERAFLLRASGVPAAPGCSVTTNPGELRCSVPGRAAPMLDVNLGDQADTADIRLSALGTQSFDTALVGRVVGGEGNDKLTSSAGGRGRLVTRPEIGLGWQPGRLRLFGGPGADRLRGGDGVDHLDGGPGPGDINPGVGRDHVDGGLGEDRVRTNDGSIDTVSCRAGLDRATLDGIDLPRECEKRVLTGPPRAVATGAVAANDYGDGADRLLIFVACPVDARTGCQGRITLAVPGGRTISRGVNLARGRTVALKFFRVDLNRVIRRGVGVSVRTRRRTGETVEFAERLPVPDARYATSE